MSDTWTLRCGQAAVEVDLADGGRLTSLRVGELELLGGVATTAIGHGSFVMAPWAGRIRRGRLVWGDLEFALPADRVPPHAGHGLVVDNPWQAVRVGSQRVRLQCPLDARWPAAGFVVQDITVGEHHLMQQVEVHASGDAFPATAGWHPWFRRELGMGQPAQLQFQASGMLQRDDEGIPDGRVVPVPPGPWDDCFVGVQWPVVIAWPGALRLSIEADTDMAVIYDHRSAAFCVEPQSGPPDGPNTAPRVVSPDDPLVVRTLWRWS